MKQCPAPSTNILVGKKAGIEEVVEENLNTTAEAL